MKKPELLCPVGSEDSLDAAILGGADAVYFGGTAFNARMNAKNFDHNAARRAIKRCHEKGVRVYVTLNTLLTDRQIPLALQEAAFFYEAGADALIVADLGLARSLKSAFPDLPLHASTQTFGHNALAAGKLAAYGFERMVAARELSKENLSYLVKHSPIEIEVFAHGAICACHSGQCLMSSMIGNRSGNRGECAQPCRLPYNRAYPISFRDLCLAGHVKELIEMGVASLKIEGRMKNPAYVYAVAAAYRKLLDENRNAGAAEIEALARVFSRSGFTDGYFTGRINASMLGVRRDEDKQRSQDAAVRFRPLYHPLPPIKIEREKNTPPLPEPEALPNPGFEKILSARFYAPEQIPRTHPFDVVFLPLERFDEKKANGFVMPAVIPDDETAAVRASIRRAVESGAKYALVTSPGQIPLLENNGLRLFGDFRLNITNARAAAFYPEISGFLVSPELNLAQIRDLAVRRGVIVYGRLPLMLLEKRVGAPRLVDRRGAVFPVLSEGKRDLILNSVPLYMLDKTDKLKKAGVGHWHFLFTTETPAEIIRVLRAFEQKDPPAAAVKRIR